MGAALAVIVTGAGCTKLPPPADVTRCQRTLYRAKEARARALAPVPFNQGRIQCRRAAVVCRDSDRVVCRSRDSAASRRLAQAIDQARWLGFDRVGLERSQLPADLVREQLAKQSFERLADLRYDRLERIRMLEVARRLGDPQHAALVDRLLGWHRKHLDAVRDAEEAKRQRVVKRRRRLAVAQQRARAQERSVLIGRARVAFGARAVVSTPAGLTMVLGKLFAPGESTLLEKAGPKLVALEQLARRFVGYSLLVGGHPHGADGRGDDGLTLARARAVKAYLVGHEVLADRVSIVGLGPASTLSPLLTQTARGSQISVTFED